jgi:hypothetical protein
VHEEHLVQAQRLHVTEAPLVVDEDFAVAQESVVHGVPRAAQLFGDLLDAASVLANLSGQPAAGAVGRQVTREGDATVLLSPGPRQTPIVRAEEPTLVPDQTHRASVDRQVHQGDERPVLHTGDHPTLGASHDRSARFEVDDERFSVVTLDAENVYFGQINEAFAHAARVCFHGGSSYLWVLNYQQTCRAPAFL